MLKAGQWHLPYVHTYFEDGKQRFTSQADEKEVSLMTAVKISSSCVAQVSYRKLDDSLEKAMKVYDMLNLPVNGVYPDDPPHFSPTEHIAKAGDCDVQLSGNFHTDDFIQYRKVLELGIEGKVIGG